MSKRNPKIDRRVLMKNEVPIKKTVLERLLAKEKVFNEKKVLMYQVKISKLPVGEDVRKYYAVDPENLIVQQKAQLLKQDGLMKGMRTDFNTQRTTLEKEMVEQKERFKILLEKFKHEWQIEKHYYRASVAVAWIIIIIMVFI